MMQNVNGVVAELRKERQLVDQALAAVEPLTKVKRTKAQGERLRRILRTVAAITRKAQHSR